jgi:hypothetical protein
VAATESEFPIKSQSHDQGADDSLALYRSSFEFLLGTVSIMASDARQ